MHRSRAVSAMVLIGALLWMSSTAASAADLQNCEVRPAGNIVTQDMADQINQLRSWSQKAANAEAVNWLYVPVLLYRENTFAINNPSNGQGMFQLYSYVSNWRSQYAEAHGLSESRLDDSLTPFPSSQGADMGQDDFVSQAQIALQYLKSAAKQVKTLGLTTPDPLTVAWAFFTYNGRHPGYYSQAARLHERYPDSFLYPFEGSPYVYNNWDAAHTGDLYIVQKDGGRLSNHVDDKVGAFTLYYELQRQCDPGSLPPSSASLNHPTERPSPFSGQNGPILEPVGKLPPPWFALVGFLGAAALMLLLPAAMRQSWWAGIWGVGLIFCALIIHQDDLSLQKAWYLPHGPAWLVGFKLALIIVATLSTSLAVIAAIRFSSHELPGGEGLRNYLIRPTPRVELKTALLAFKVAEPIQKIAKGGVLVLVGLVCLFYYFLGLILAILLFVCKGFFASLMLLRGTARWWLIPVVVCLVMWLAYHTLDPPNPGYSRFGIHIMFTAGVAAILCGLVARIKTRPVKG